MGVKQMIARAGDKAAGKVSKLARLSSEELQQVEDRRQAYLSEMPDPNDAAAVELTSRLLAANGVEIYNAYLPQLEELYIPVEATAEYEGKEFNDGHNIRYIRITKWVTDKSENSLEKLINVYEVLSNEECNIALIFHRGVKGSDVYLAVVNTPNAANNVNADSYSNRICDALKGNFPGSEWEEERKGRLPFLDARMDGYSVATATNIPTEKSEKFISQTIEKLLDGVVPANKRQEYTVILLATPLLDVDERKMRLQEIYSGLAPYAGWQTNYTFTESSSFGSSATVGVNVGASAGVQNGTNSAVTNSDATTESSQQSTSDNKSTSETDSSSEATADSHGGSSGKTEGDTYTEGQNSSHSESKGKNRSNEVNASITTGSSTGVSAHAGVGGTGVGVEESVHVDGTVGGGHTWGSSETIGDTTGTSTSTSKNIAETVTETVNKTLTSTAGKAIGSTIGRTIGNTLGKAVTKTVATTAGITKAVNFGVNFGANFARTSNVTATIGKNEGITQTFTNYNIKHSLELLEQQMKRYEESSALGMWDFAAYVISEDHAIANNVAHSYIALTEGAESFMSKTAVNLWRGDTEDSGAAEEICAYLKDLRHPIFGLRPDVTNQDATFNVYPAFVTATTPLTGKELAYSLNFPRKSIAGLPVIECAEFGRNVVSYGNGQADPAQLRIGRIFHMNHEERNEVSLSARSLASHAFVTGSTGSGKSNTVYQILDEAKENGVKFLVVEPAKGEYKNVFGNDKDVTVYGTNPALSELLRINPFSFPKEIHVFEHMDRLVEIFNVCWPMYAAMPAVLKSAIEQSYVDCGWDLTASTNPYGEDLYPCFADVARNIRTIIDSSEYDAENKGAYKGSLLTRLQSLTNGINGMIFTSDALSDQALFDQNAIVDLSRVGSNETKSLLMGMLVLKLQEYRMTEQQGMNGSLRHLTVLEEAHNLLRRTSPDQPVEGGNLLGKSVEMIANAIAEMRTYGEGFVIVDQAPGLLDMAAIRNTNTKIIMRLPDQDDRELVGRSANLNDDQIIELAKLPCGVAAIYQNEWIQPVLCKVNRFDVQAGNYRYDRPVQTNDESSADDALTIAELLSKGTQVDQETFVKDIRPTLDQIGMKASSIVATRKMLENPPKEPRMTRLAPIMAQLFPDIMQTMRQAYSESSEAAIWTNQIRDEMQRTFNREIQEQVRRDIIQCIVTEYLLHEVNNMKDLQKWSVEGGLS